MSLLFVGISNIVFKTLKRPSPTNYVTKK